MFEGEGRHRVKGDGANPARQRITDLPESLRPREEMQRVGEENVSVAVLLAVVLGAGAPGVNVVELAQRLLAAYGSLNALSRASVEELAGDPRFPGLGRVKAQVLKAALQLAVRLAAERVAKGGSIRSAEDVAAVLRETARPLNRERFWILLLDAKHRLKGPPEQVSEGVLDASLVHPREVFRKAVQAACSAIILVHNHPSGDPSPSAEDLRVTRQLIEAGRLMGIRVLDHVVLGRPSDERTDDFVSLRDAGLASFDEA